MAVTPRGAHPLRTGAYREEACWHTPEAGRDRVIGADQIRGRSGRWRIPAVAARRITGCPRRSAGSRITAARTIGSPTALMCITAARVHLDIEQSRQHPGCRRAISAPIMAGPPADSIPSVRRSPAHPASIAALLTRRRRRRPVAFICLAEATANRKCPTIVGSAGAIAVSSVEAKRQRLLGAATAVSSAVAGRESHRAAAIPADTRAVTAGIITSPGRAL